MRLLPAADRQIEYKIEPQQTGFQSDETDMQLAPNDDVIHLQGDRDLNNAAYLMTGDGNVVRPRRNAVLFPYRSKRLSAGRRPSFARPCGAPSRSVVALDGVAQPGQFWGPRIRIQCTRQSRRAAEI